MGKKWTVEVQEASGHGTFADGELFIELNDDILAGSGFKVGDELEWVDHKDGSWMLKKKEEEFEWVLVDAVSTFRMRYMVQVPKGKSIWALDTVTMQEAKEFSQEHMGEQIVSHRVVTEREALDICDADNDYCSTWNDEHKIQTFFTKDGEKVEK